MFASARLRVIRRRRLQALPVLVLATFVVFGLLKLMPGDIAIMLAGENATEHIGSPGGFVRGQSERGGPREGL